MLGEYTHFPKIYHGTARFPHVVSIYEVQKAIFSSLYRLNTDEGNLSLPYMDNCDIETYIEVGIAEDLTFNYLRKDNLEICLKTIIENHFKTLDFLFIVKYYITKHYKKRPLWFDYYLVRFILDGSEIEINVYHEKGTQRFGVNELIDFLATIIKKELEKER